MFLTITCVMIGNNIIQFNNYTTTNYHNHQVGMEILKVIQIHSTNNGSWAKWTSNLLATNSNSYAVTDCEVQNVNSVLNAIENESFKSDKMMVAKQATKNKCLSS